jgi:release factor glutamine methyltransferase
VLGARNWDLYAQLPASLPEEEILEHYDVTPAAAERRSYRWNGWDFELPAGVFQPGAISRLLHDRLLDGRFPVAGLRYAAMGVGLGVEAVVAGKCGARSVHALDVHEASVSAASRHYKRIVGGGGPPFVGIVSDLWEMLPDGIQFDVVTFNAPLIDLRLSEDPYILRNRCVGIELATRFFHQMTSKRLLAPGGVTYLTVSNIHRLRDVVAMSLHAGFDVEALHVEEWLDWPGPSLVQTYLLGCRNLTAFKAIRGASSGT